MEGGGSGGGGEEVGGMKGGAEGDDLLAHRCCTCAAKSPGNRGNHTNLAFFRGMGSWAGCVLASKAIELDRESFRKLRGETETEFVRNLKCLVNFELRT